MTNGGTTRGPTQLMRGRAISDTLFSLLDEVPYGAYAVSIDQTIMYWNEAAQRILGHRRADVVGRRCYEVVTGYSPAGLTSECASGCPSLRHLRGGLVPSPLRLRMNCASGERKWVTVAPLVVAGIFWDAPVLVHLFDEELEGSPQAQTKNALGEALDSGRSSGLSAQRSREPSPETPDISPRELEILRLVAMGWETPRIAEVLGISPHTVRNHIRNFRQKLNATNKLDAVLSAIRLGILGVID